MWSLVHEGEVPFKKLISFHDKVIHLIDQGKPVDTTFWIQQSFQNCILLEKMSSIQLDKYII